MIEKGSKINDLDGASKLTMRSIGSLDTTTVKLFAIVQGLYVMEVVISAQIRAIEPRVIAPVPFDHLAFPCSVVHQPDIRPVLASDG